MNSINQMIESAKGCFAIEGMSLDEEDIQRGVIFYQAKNL